MEVTAKAIEIMTNNLKGMETLVEKVKRLEEGQLILEGRIDRLKKYNVELRAIIVQLSSSMCPIVDVDKGDVHDNSNQEARKSRKRLSMDGRVLMELSDTSVTAAANDETDELHNIPPEIIQNILMNLDKNTLYGCRLVSKKLNDIANEVIIKLHPRHIQISESEYEDEPEPKLEALSGLQSLMRKSDAPEVLMQALSSGSCLIKEESLSIMQEFGRFLKTLNIEGCNIRFSLMQSILLEWCPNLEELRLDCFKKEETLDCPQDLDLKKPESDLKINKLRRLIISTVYGAKLNAELVISIAKSSPDLKFFKIEGLGNELANQLVAQLKNFPDITKRFEELWISYTSYVDGEDETNILMAFLDVELGPNLKSLTFQANEGFEYDDFSRFLNKLASELETLNLMISFDDEESQPIYEIHWKTSLPKMPKLRVFKCIGEDYFHLKSIDFLEYMPNLERLVLAQRFDWGDVVNVTPGRVDELFSSSVKFKSHNLKELILFGYITSDLTCTYISRHFPNLQKLYVSLGYDREEENCAQWFENVFEGFGQMSNLTTLYVDFGVSYQSPSVELQVAFENLVNLKNLRYVVFISEDVIGPNFVSALKSLLSKVDKLQCLRLINFTMDLSDSMELFDWLGKRRTTTCVEFFNKKLSDLFIPWKCY